MNKKQLGFIRNCFKIWLPLAITITALCGLIYLTVQQSYRMSANDPQIQLAEDVSVNLANGQNPQNYVPAIKTNLAKSLAVYILIYDSNGKLLASSVEINGKDPVVPSGIFSDTKAKDETRFTWQTPEGIRSALVVKYYKGIGTGFVAVGRSIKEVEKRENDLQNIVLLGLISTLVLSFASVYILQKFK
jgi:hypothetical protein